MDATTGTTTSSAPAETATQHHPLSTDNATHHRVIIMARSSSSEESDMLSNDNNNNSWSGSPVKGDDGLNPKRSLAIDTNEEKYYYRNIPTEAEETNEDKVVADRKGAVGSQTSAYGRPELYSLNSRRSASGERSLPSSDSLNSNSERDSAWALNYKKRNIDLDKDQTMDRIYEDIEKDHSLGTSALTTSRGSSYSLGEGHSSPGNTSVTGAPRVNPLLRGDKNSSHPYLLYDVLRNNSDYTHSHLLPTATEDMTRDSNQLAALFEPTAIDFLHSLVPVSPATPSLASPSVLPRLASGSYSSSASSPLLSSLDSFAHNVSMSIIRAMTAEVDTAAAPSSSSSSSSSVIISSSIGSTMATPVATTTSLGLMGKVQIPMYAIIFLLAVIGNSLVILTLVQNKRMRTITNVFLLNLAISDLFLGVLCMPFTLVGTLKRDFVFGEFMCKILPFLQGKWRDDIYLWESIKGRR